MTNDFREQAEHKRWGETVDEAAAAFHDMTDAFGRKVLTGVERAASKALKKKEAENGMTEYRKAQNAFHANRERLKAERLAREAASSFRRHPVSPQGRAGGEKVSHLDLNNGTVLLF